MRISYSKNEDDAVAAVRGEKSSHLTVLAIAISIIFIVIALGLWFGYSQTRKTIESIPEAVIPPIVNPEVQKARVYEAIDGIAQCHTNIPNLTTAEDRAKRQKCYSAVMVIFTTSAICNLTMLDPVALDICRQAETQFAKDYPRGIPQDAVFGPGANTSNPAGITVNTNASVGGQAGNRNTSANTNAGGSAQGTPSNTNSSTGNSNSSANLNANVSTPSLPTTASSGTSSGNTNDSSNTNTSSNPDVTPPAPDICIIDTGEVVLLEHTNNCQ